MVSIADLMGGVRAPSAFGAVPGAGPSVTMAPPAGNVPMGPGDVRPQVGPGMYARPNRVSLAEKGYSRDKIAESLAKNMSMAQYGTYDRWQELIDRRGVNGVINDYGRWMRSIPTISGPSRPYNATNNPWASGYGGNQFGGAPGMGPGQGGPTAPGVPPPGTLPGRGTLPGGPPSAGNFIGTPGAFPGAPQARPATPQWWDALRAQYQAQALRGG